MAGEVAVHKHKLKHRVHPWVSVTARTCVDSWCAFSIQPCQLFPASHLSGGPHLFLESNFEPLLHPPPSHPLLTHSKHHAQVAAGAAATTAGAVAAGVAAAVGAASSSQPTQLTPPTTTTGLATMVAAMAATGTSPASAAAAHRLALRLLPLAVVVSVAAEVPHALRLPPLAAAMDSAEVGRVLPQGRRPLALEMAVLGAVVAQHVHRPQQAAPASARSEIAVQQLNLPVVAFAVFNSGCKVVCWGACWGVVRFDSLGRRSCY